MAAAQLSGGEQQMLAISRALLLSNPRLLVMDEPTEGLAPVIVEQVDRDCSPGSPKKRTSSILLVEQNLGVATAVAERVAMMVNGRINRVMDAARAGRRPRTAAAASGRRTACRRRGRGIAETGAGAAVHCADVSGRAPGCRRLRRCADGNCLSSAGRTAEPLGHPGGGACGRVGRRRARRARCSRSRLPNGSAAPPWSWVPSTPRGANCDSSATGCARCRYPVRTVDLSTSGKPVDAPT